VHGTAPTLGILVTNLGTPDAPTAAALRRYLAEFLWDPRIVEIPRPVWWMILHGVILRTRPKRSAHAYQSIWTNEGSPLLVIARRQAAALQAALTQQHGGSIKVALGMRYGNPSIADALDELRKANVQRILVFPLYPQYAAATAASTFDAVAAAFKTWRWIPELRMITHYHDDPAYIKAVATSVKEHWAQHGQAEKLLFSFHGIPKRCLLAGDPYHCECHVTARLIAEQLELPPERWQLAFQSRFGREEWLKPYTDKTLESFGKAGIKSVDIVCPGFSADCLETLEEMAMLNRGVFLKAGGERYNYIPALNDRPDHIQALAALVSRHINGWQDASTVWDAAASRRRAVEMGAAQ
jgi:protoporphyrin/coproporphyrin ferrochelatase